MLNSLNELKKLSEESGSTSTSKAISFSDTGYLGLKYSHDSSLLAISYCYFTFPFSSFL
jgi:hypothetical protein